MSNRKPFVRKCEKCRASATRKEGERYFCDQCGRDPGDDDDGRLINKGPHVDEIRWVL